MLSDEFGLGGLYKDLMRNLDDIGVRTSISGDFWLEPAGVEAAYAELYGVYEEIRIRKEAVVVEGAAADSRNACGMIVGVDLALTQINEFVNSKSSLFVRHLAAAEQSAATLLNAIYASAAASQRSDEEGAAALHSAASGTDE